MNDNTKQIFNMFAPLNTSVNNPEINYKKINISTIGNDEQNLLSSHNALTNQMKKWEPIRSFGLELPKTSEQIIESANKITEKSTSIVNYLNKDQNPIDGNGNSLINYNSDKDWFFNNIHFVFSVGKIFDEEDNKKMDSVLNSFVSKPNNAYLLNNYQQLNFDHTLIKKIEERYGISNGNYHILLGLICSASEEELINSPLEEFDHKGIITCVTTWKGVFDIMKKYIILFGFIAEYKDNFEPKIGSSKNIRSNMYNVNGSVINMNMPIEKFINKNDNPDDLVKQKKYKYNEKENMRNGQIINETQRVYKNDKLRPRHEQGMSLYDRIATDNIVDTVPSKQVGGMLKMNEYYQPVDKKESEFILFNDISAYDKETGTNIVEMVGPVTRGEMPNFSYKNNNAKNKTYIPSFISVFPKNNNE